MRMRGRICERHHLLQTPHHITGALRQRHRELIERAPRVATDNTNVLASTTKQPPGGRKRLALCERKRTLIPGRQIISAIATTFHLDWHASVTERHHIAPNRALVHLQPSSQLLATHATVC